MVEIIYFLIIIIASGLGSISGMGGGIIIKPLMDSFGYHSVSNIAFYSSFSVFIMAIISTIKRFSQSKEIKWRLIFGILFFCFRRISRSSYFSSFVISVISTASIHCSNDFTICDATCIICFNRF